MKIKLLILSAIILMCSCSSGNGIIEEPPTDPIPDNPKEYIVSFGFTGEITNIEESPLSRAVTNDLYGIQVYSMPATETDQSKYKPYAYGLFDDKANMTIKLLGGYKYKFASTITVNGKGKLHLSSDGYGFPFSSGAHTPIINSFTYSSSKIFENLSSGFSSLPPYGVAIYRPNIERYYGESTEYLPAENKSVSIDMKRVSFGIKVKTEGLTEGKISISPKDGSTIYINHPSTEVNDIFTFKNEDTYSSPMGWTKDDYTEVIPVSMVWEKTDGASVPLVTKEITFKRNKLTTITVKVKDNSINNGVDISNENTPMGDGGNITIDTGNGTDTGVNPAP